MNYTYQIITPQDIVLGVNRLEVEYRISNDAGGGTVGCSIDYRLTVSANPSQPNRTSYVFRTCIITSNQIPCHSTSNVPIGSISSITLKFISSLGNTIASITIEDRFDIAQNYCLVITFIVIDNIVTQDVEDIIIDRYNPEDIIDYVIRPTNVISHDRNKLIRSYHDRVSTAAVRYTNSISDVVSNCNFVPYLAVQDRYFVINYEDDVTSEYATVKLPNIKISGWTDRDIYFFEKVYADVSDPSVSITDDMGLLEPLVSDPYNSTQPFTLVHNMYPLSINRNGEIVVYNNQPKDFPYVTSLFHKANVSQIKYGDKIYKPLTPYMYYCTITQTGKPTEVEILYSYLNRSYVALAKVQSSKILSATTRIDINTVTRNIILPVDYNILFYLESQWDRLLGMDDLRIFVMNHNGEAIEYPVIVQSGEGQTYNVVIFQKGNNNAIKLLSDVDLDWRVMRLGAPLSFFAGGGLLGWGKHKPEYESEYYLFSWYKILRTKRLTSGVNRADDYLRYYYYYQYII